MYDQWIDVTINRLLDERYEPSDVNRPMGISDLLHSLQLLQHPTLNGDESRALNRHYMKIIISGIVQKAYSELIQIYLDMTIGVPITDDNRFVTLLHRISENRIKYG